MEQKIKEIIERAASDHAQTIENRFGDIEVGCESPIEKIMAAALVAENEAHAALRFAHFLDQRFCWETRLDKNPNGAGGVHLYQQVKVGEYRVDFLLEVTSYAGKVGLLVVECDGHEYHERTKAQAARDRSRDRWMTSKGVTVMRFTGSEIWKDARDCAAQVFDHVESMMWGNL